MVETIQWKTLNNTNLLSTKIAVNELYLQFNFTQKHAISNTQNKNSFEKSIVKH